MTTPFPESFKQNYQCHLQHLKLKGLQPKTIDAYSRAVRRIGLAFDYRIDSLSSMRPAHPSINFSVLAFL
jgi:integrase/recombinase XerD